MEIIIMASIIVLLIVGIIVVINVKKMIDNIRNGRSIDGCDGDCSHCKSCHHSSS